MLVAVCAEAVTGKRKAIPATTKIAVLIAFGTKLLTIAKKTNPNSTFSDEDELKSPILQG